MKFKYGGLKKFLPLSKISFRYYIHILGDYDIGYLKYNSCIYEIYYILLGIYRYNCL